MPLDVLSALLALSAGLLGWWLAALRRPTPLPAPIVVPDPQADPNARWSAFLVNMSHELRTPLNGVIGFTEMLLDADLPDLQQRQVRLIADSGRAMLRLLNDILDIARIEAGQLRLVPEPVTLRDELEQCLGLMQPIASARGLALTLTAADDLPETLQLDRLRLRQVVLGLVGNALKFTEQGQVELTARVARGKIEIAVCDTGIGIAVERHESLFTPFAPGADGARPFGGTGLGLAMTDRIVALMGGSISLTSTPGIGSAFTITLPIEQADDPLDEADLPAGTRNPALEGLRVLIAEDHEINQQLIMAMAQSLGLDARLAANGREAVEAVLRAQQDGAPFQLVLMDVQMPEMDGLEATRALRAAGCAARTLPIIALTANCYAQDVAAARDAGMQAHLCKPIMLADLARALAEHMPTQAPAAAASAHNLLRQPEGVSAAIHTLDHRYRQRKQALAVRIEAALADEQPETTDWAAITTALHRLAGVAANFGEAELGSQSRQLERLLKDETLADQRLRLLAERWPQWLEAA